VLSPWPARELEHFERVLALCAPLAFPCVRWRPPPYGAALAQVGRAGRSRGRMLRQLSGGGLIEARSHGAASARLAAPLPRRRTGALYGDLLASEGPVTSGSIWCCASALAADRP